MLVFEWILVVLLGAVLLTALARRIGIPYPILLALGGAALAFLPGGPIWTLEPSLALALFIAPVLLDAAFDTSLRDLKKNWAPLVGLVLVAVVLTTIAVAAVAKHFVPDMPWAVAIVLGAIVAPPDAGAATTILRQSKLPHRLLTILEGESLLNDATALLIYRLAIGAVATGSFVVGDVAPTFGFAVVGSFVAGYLIAKGSARVLRMFFDDAPSSIILQFVSTFGVWIFAERIGLSGILTVVVYAMVAAQSAPMRAPARIRVPSYAVWDTVVFVLNVLAFVVIGLQVRPIWELLDPAVRIDYVRVALAVLATVILVRIVWVMSYNAAVRLKIRVYGFHPRPTLPPTIGSGIIVSWCGMRGIVTLAAAFALPTGDASHAFPFRDLILLTAFCVVLGTLVLQGLTLRPLIRLMHFREDDEVQREFERARIAAYGAAVDALDGDQSPEANTLRNEYGELLRRSRSDENTERTVELPTAALRRRMIAAARQTAHDLRMSGDIGDAAYHRLEEELDRAELSAALPE